MAEIYDPISKSWTIKFNPNGGAGYCVGQGNETQCPGAGSPCYGSANAGVPPHHGIYPRMHLMPSGSIVTCGFKPITRLCNPVTGAWSTLVTTNSLRDYGTSFLLPLNNNATERGKVLLVGGSFGAESTLRLQVLRF